MRATSRLGLVVQLTQGVLSDGRREQRLVVVESHGLALCAASLGLLTLQHAIERCLVEVTQRTIFLDVIYKRLELTQQLVKLVAVFGTCRDAIAVVIDVGLHGLDDPRRRGGCVARELGGAAQSVRVGGGFVVGSEQFIDRHNRLLSVLLHFAVAA